MAERAPFFDLPAASPAPAAGPRSVLRVLQVLRELAADPRGLTLSELARRLAVPKTSLFALLRVLESARYLANEGGTYRLGAESLALAGAVADSGRRHFPDCAMPTLKALGRRTGETGFLATLTPDRLWCQYVAVVETDNWLRFSVQVGSRKPSYATGSGRAMLAFLPAVELEALLPRFEFRKLTTQTVASRRALLAALRQVRSRGVSVVESGTVAGVTSVAAPIFDAAGLPIAAVSIGGPTERMAARLRDTEQAVRIGAEEISALLGYRAVAHS